MNSIYNNVFNSKFVAVFFVVYVFIAFIMPMPEDRFWYNANLFLMILFLPPFLMLASYVDLKSKDKQK